jgi:small ligand-binding sensory domain FIST
VRGVFFLSRPFPFLDSTPVQATPGKPQLRFGMGASASTDTARAAQVACEQALAAFAADPAGPVDAIDAAFVFFSAHHAGNAADLSATVLRTLSPRAMIGVTTAAAIGGTREMEGSPGVSVLAACMPGVTLTPFALDDLPPTPSPDEIDAEQKTLALMAERSGAAADLRCTVLFADPFSVPLVNLLPALNRSRSLAGATDAPLVGGLASAATVPGRNALLLNDRVLRAGGVGLSLRGAIHVDAVVSQGCRPFGPTMVVTKAKNNLIMELGGRPAVQAVEEAVLALGDRSTPMLAGGLFIGRVIDEYKSRFGRGDFLIRAVMGVDPARGAIAVADRVRVGQTIRLHCRDAATAHEDLALLLDAQKLYDKPKGALLFTGHGRGRKLFANTPTPESHDALAVARAFSPLAGGEHLSKPGTPFEPPLAPFPMAGCFAAGEIGPVGNQSFLHAHTACVVLFRD